MPFVASLWIYPVKSCRGIRVERAELDGRGLRHDRQFALVDADGRVITQRTHPIMAQIETSLDGDDLVLGAPGREPIRVPLSSPLGSTRAVEIWSDKDLQAEICGPQVAAWLSALVKMPVQLVRAGPSFTRPVRNASTDRVGFADAFPLLVVSEASLRELNVRLAAQGQDAVPMERFRPNLVIGDCEPHAEDTWQRFTAGLATFRGATGCARCTVVCTDQVTGSRSGEPLRTLASYRRDPAKPQEVLFGRNVINETKQGFLQVGDLVTPEVFEASPRHTRA